MGHGGRSLGHQELVIKEQRLLCPSVPNMPSLHRHKEMGPISHGLTSKRLSQNNFSSLQFLSWVFYCRDRKVTNTQFFSQNQ